MSSSTWPERDEFRQRPGALPGVHPHAVHPPEHARIEVEVSPHGVEDTRPLLHEARQNLVDVRDRKRIVGAVALHRAVGARPGTFPGLAQLVVLAHEQQILGLRTAGHQNRNGIGLGKAAQIVELAVLAIGVGDVAVAVAHRSGRENGDRVLTDHAHELAAAARELLAIHAEACRLVQPLRGRVGYTCWRSGNSSSNTTCAATRMNSTSSA